MASDLGVLLPHESNYATPEIAREASRAEAAKRADYLSQMDQFYAQLEESKRQFDQSYAFREQEFAFESQLKEKQFGHQQTIDTRGLELEERKADIEERLGLANVALLEARTETERQALEIERDRLQMEREQLRETLGFERERLGIEKELGLGQLGVQREEIELGRMNLGLTEAQTAFEQELASSKFALEQENMPRTGTQYTSPSRRLSPPTGSKFNITPTVRSRYNYNRRY